MTQQEVMDIYEKTKIQPDVYHFSCCGGSSHQRINVYTKDPIYNCKYKYDKNWMVPVCEKCDGVLKEEYKTLNEYDSNINCGIKKMYDAIIEGFNPGAKEDVG